MFDVKQVGAKRLLWQVKYWLLGFSVLFYAFLLSNNGLEIGPDSTIYVRGALNLAEGDGYTMGRYFINHFPIGLSLLYAVLIKLFPVSIFTAALVMHIIWLALSGFLFLRLLQHSGMKESIQCLGLGLWMFSAPILIYSAKLLTELPTLVILMACTLLYVKQMDRTRAYGHTLLIACLLGFGLLLRFAMIGFVGAFALLFIWQYRRSWRMGFLHAILVVLPGLLIMLGYSVYVARVYHTQSVNRVLLWHPISWDNLISFFREPLSWIVNTYHWYSIENCLLVLVISIMLIQFISMIPREHRGFKTLVQAMFKNKWFQMIAIVSGTYCLFLIVSISLFDAATTIDMRILTPLSIYFYWGIALLFNYLRKANILGRWNLLGLFLLGALFSQASSGIIKDIYNQPNGYSTAYWKNEAPRIINDTSGVWLKPKRKVYTNAVSYWIMCNNQRVIQLPQENNLIQNRTNDAFEKDMQELINKIKHDSAQVVYFYNIPRDTPMDNTIYLRKHFTDSTGLLFVPITDGMIIRAKVAREEE